MLEEAGRIDGRQLLWWLASGRRGAAEAGGHFPVGDFGSRRRLALAGHLNLDHRDASSVTY